MFTWKGPWQVTATYAVDDVVSSDGSSFIAIAQVPKGEKPPKAGYWDVMAERGRWVLRWPGAESGRIH